MPKKTFLSVPFVLRFYSTETDATTYGVFNPPANLRFTLSVKTTSLVGRPYLIFQHKLANQIINLREERGMNFSDIADWLNKNGYTTPLGKTFTNPHAHSIYSKFYKRQERFGKTSYSQVSDIAVRYKKSAISGAENAF
ncbi:MAG: hypothetical protein VXX78_04550 [Pseudomonadota bacterium]|nr:hypothetical protein [Pseudomonadota bacterium]